MFKFARLIVVMCAAVCFFADVGTACQYNVREIGFADFGTQQYYLFGYVNEQTNEDLITSFKQTANTIFMDSNIRFELVNIDTQKTHPAIKYLSPDSKAPLPALVFVSSEGKTIPIALPATNVAFREKVFSVMDDVVSSPVRKKLLEQLADTYGIVLLIEGNDAEKNEKAKKIVQTSIKNISSQMHTMPKSIAVPPKFIALTRDSFKKEKILLWSLGVELEKTDEPVVIVMYGRARMMGPAIPGELITEERLTGVLAVIGADCECGLDRKWILGKMIPARWDEKIQAKITKQIGFDPENPMVKTEMSQIIRFGHNSQFNKEKTDSFPTAAFGYQELVIEFDKGEEPEQTEPQQAPVSDIPIVKAEVCEPQLEVVTPAQTKPQLQNLVYVAVGLVSIILIIGIVVIVRSARKKT